jgi:hypothetical protein
MTTKIIHWFARIWSLISLFLIIGFIIGEGIYLKTTGECISFLFFPIGISVGMIIGWWKEGIGGIITISSFLIFYLIFYLVNNAFPKGIAWLLFSMPGFLFTISWIYRKK